MILFKKKMPANFNLFLIGDIHLGTVMLFRTGFKQLVDFVHSPFKDLQSKHNYVGEMGDSVEAITTDDRRFSMDTISKDSSVPLEQMKAYVKMLKPIAKKMLFKLQGNHEAALHRYGDIAAHIADELNVPYGTYSCKYSFDYRNKTMFKMFATHGRKSINSTADDPKRRRTNMELVLKRHLKHKFGDCLLMAKGHTHKLLVCRPNPELYLTDDGKEVIQKYTHSNKVSGYIHPDHRWYVNTGSFMKLYREGVSSYAERAEYDPVELGFPVVIVRDQKIVNVKKVTL